jgi:hypothetical protein
MSPSGVYMNAATLSRSERLKRVRKFLSDGKAHSTLEIIRKANVCAVSSIVAELRCNGSRIDCQRKGDRWYYRLKT